MNAVLMTQSPRYCERIFYPELIPLKTEICTSTQPGDDNEEYITLLERTVPTALQLTRQSMTAAGATSFLLDAGTDITLYRSVSEILFFLILLSEILQFNIYLNQNQLVVFFSNNFGRSSLFLFIRMLIIIILI